MSWEGHPIGEAHSNRKLNLSGSAQVNIHNNCQHSFWGDRSVYTGSRTFREPSNHGHFSTSFSSGAFRCAGIALAVALDTPIFFHFHHTTMVCPVRVALHLSHRAFHPSSHNDNSNQYSFYRDFAIASYFILYEWH
jgi:hypothetical protein